MGKKQQQAEKIAAEAAVSGATKKEIKSELKDFYKESGNKITDKEKAQMKNVMGSLSETKTKDITTNINGQEVSGTKTVVTCGDAKAVHKSYNYEYSDSNIYNNYKQNIDITKIGSAVVSRRVDTHTIDALSRDGINWYVNEQFLNTYYDYNMFSGSVSGSYRQGANTWNSIGNGRFNYKAEKINYVTNSQEWNFKGKINSAGYYVNQSSESRGLDLADIKVEEMFQKVLGNKTFSQNFSITEKGIQVKSSVGKTNQLNTSKLNTNKSKSKNVNTGSKTKTKIDGFVISNPAGYRRSQGYTTFKQNGKTYVAILFDKNNSKDEGKNSVKKVCIYEVTTNGKNTKLVSEQEVAGLGHGNTLTYLGKIDGEHKFATTQNFKKTNNGENIWNTTNEIAVLSYSKKNGIDKDIKLYNLPDDIKPSELYYDSKRGELYAKSDGKMIVYNIDLDEKGGINFKKDSSGNVISKEYNFYGANNMGEELSKVLGKKVDDSQILKNAGTSDGKYYYQGISIRNGKNYILTYDLSTQKLIKATELDIPSEVMNSGDYKKIEIEDLDIADGNITANVCLISGKNKYNYYKGESYVTKVSKDDLT